MLNRVVLVGRMTKDPDLRFTPNGVAVATFTVAINRPFTNQAGEKETDFINCVVWKKQAENVANYLKKGSLCGVDGRLQTRNYEKDGQRVYITEVLAESVQFLEPRNAGASESTGSSQTRDNGQSNTNAGQQIETRQTGRETGQNKLGNDPFSNTGQPIDISDDDLPF